MCALPRQLTVHVSCLSLLHHSLHMQHSPVDLLDPEHHTQLLQIRCSQSKEVNGSCNKSTGGMELSLSRPAYVQ